MKVHLSRGGYLVVSAETETELFALRTWWDKGSSRGICAVLKDTHDRVEEIPDLPLRIAEDDNCFKLGMLDAAITEPQSDDNAGCTFAGPGRGDCEHSIGLPGKSIPGQHDGEDDTVDVYGRPNGWCWSCWKSYKIQILESRLNENALPHTVHVTGTEPDK